jgi:hypothetical protein
VAEELEMTASRKSGFNIAELQITHANLLIFSTGLEIPNATGGNLPKLRPAIPSV